MNEKKKEKQIHLSLSLIKKKEIEKNDKENEIGKDQKRKPGKEKKEYEKWQRKKGGKRRKKEKTGNG